VEITEEFPEMERQLLPAKEVIGLFFGKRGETSIRIGAKMRGAIGSFLLDCLRGIGVNDNDIVIPA
jgi:hypothetical protein